MNQDQTTAVNPAEELAAGMKAAAARVGMPILGDTKVITLSALSALNGAVEAITEGRVATAFFVSDGKARVALGMPSPSGGMFPLSASLDFQGAVVRITDDPTAEPTIEINPVATADIVVAVMVAAVSAPLFLSPTGDGFSAWVFALDGDSPDKHAAETLPIAQLHRHPPGRSVLTTAVAGNTEFGDELRKKWRHFIKRTAELNLLGSQQPH